MEADESGDGRGRGSAVLTYIISYFQPERNKGEGKERTENQGKRQEERHTKIFFRKKAKRGLHFGEKCGIISLASLEGAECLHRKNEVNT